MVKYKTLRTLKLNEYKHYPITLEELKLILVDYYYPHQDVIKNSEMRELIVTEIKDRYQTVSTVIFSVNGSPPKGIGILLNNQGDDKHWRGNFIAIGNTNVSKEIYQVTILKPVLYPQNNTQDTPKPLESGHNSSYTQQEKA